MFTYFMFFFNVFLGLVSCLLRILKSIVVGALFLSRLDISSLPREFQFFDPGTENYSGVGMGGVWVVCGWCVGGVRILKSIVVGALFLSRLDISSLPREFQFFDPGTRNYSGWLGRCVGGVRILKSIVVGALFLSRLDISSLPREFQFFDPGTRNYSGWLGRCVGGVRILKSIVVGAFFLSRLDISSLPREFQFFYPGTRNYSGGGVGWWWVWVVCGWGADPQFHRGGRPLPVQT